MEANNPVTITRQIATGLLSLFESGEPQLRPPYPAALQQGFDRLTWFCQLRALTPPQSVVELMQWCSRPFSEWTAFVNADVPDWVDADSLLCNGRPTYYCDELHCPGLNVADELLQNEVFATMITDCRNRQDQNGYVTFRRFLIENPIIDSSTFLLRLADFPSATIRELLRTIYEPLPDTYTSNSHLYRCQSCRYVQTRLTNGRLVCENDVCRLYYSHLPALLQPYTHSLLRLKRPFRRYITYPGIAERQLAEKLRRLGVGVHLWPQFDRYDLHITLPNGTGWAIDVKDWSNPFRLGEAIQNEAVMYSADYTRFIYVVPNHRLQFQRDYVRAVRSRCVSNSRRIEVLSERELVRQVNKHLTGR